MRLMFTNHSLARSLKSFASGPFAKGFAQRRLSRGDFSNDGYADATVMNALRVMEMEIKRKYLKTGVKLNASCEDRFFCEVAVKGRKFNADVISRILYIIALLTPINQAEKNGLGTIFKSIRNLNCDAFKCDKLRNLYC
ncbi:CLUMA_CG017040, isoform A [Clunio marinus]|uniref:CLUMA_CG017040, isoform A n=1 Tax=Clunio marinus TaxID=568069 RepID=A0A1J1IUQ6_9DIPT|nr:CLUMA_CG017040, isoform A [Clunio marinus]